MPEPNGHQDNLPRLDRIARAMEQVIHEHELFRDENKKLLQSQVLLQCSLEKLGQSLEKLKERTDETRSNLDALVNLVDRDHRESHERPNRVENRL
jgi:hypothetical protein